MMGTPCTPAALSWSGTSGVRDGAWCHPGVTRGWRGSSAGGEARGAGNLENSWIMGKNITDTGAGLERGARGQKRVGILVLVPSSGE